MQLPTYLIRRLLTASVLVFALSACGRDADVNFLPPPPPALQTEQAQDTRPVPPEGAETSEALYEQFVSDVFDWGDRRNALAYRWCKAYSEYAQEAIGCGVKPDGVE